MNTAVGAVLVLGGIVLGVWGAFRERSAQDPGPEALQAPVLPTIKVSRGIYDWSDDFASRRPPGTAREPARDR